MEKDLEVSDGQTVVFKTVKFQKEVCCEVVAYAGKIYIEVKGRTLLVEPRDNYQIVVHCQE